jgi:DNA helicase-2/ATP-dependent DNA helicase PcrA
MGSQESDLEVIATAYGNKVANEPTIPDIVSATSWVRMQKGDLSAWDIARPVPSRPTAARRLGTEVHRMIEEKSRGVSAFPEEMEMDEPGEYVEDRSVMDDMLAKFEVQYAERKLAVLPSGEPMVELPFTLKKDGRIIRGRIDAVYETDDGGLEIVDFKTGQRFEPVPGEADQLELYADALRALGLTEETNIKLTYAFLSPT